MTSRYVPYATTPGRLLTQLISDIVVAVWTLLWLLVAVAVYDAVSTIAEFGQQVNTGATGIAGNLESAGGGAAQVPLIGGVLSGPLAGAGQAAHSLAAAGHTLDTTASWLAWVLALAVASPPILAVMMPWLALRLHFFRRKWTVMTLAATPAGEELLALRALANRPLTQLTTVSTDPVRAWRSDDPAVIRSLAALELRAAGVARLPRSGQLDH